MDAPAGNIKQIFAAIAHRYDLANLVLSFGFCLLWRWQVLRAVVESLPADGRIKGARALDLCTGTGALLEGLSRRFFQVVGVDFCWPMLEVANQRRRRGRLAGCQLVLGDALCLPFLDRTFDIITVAYGVRNLCDIQQGLKEIRRVLKKGGRVFVLEFSRPRARIWREIFGRYSRYLIPFVGWLLTGKGKAYQYLHESTAVFPSGEEFARLLRQADFVQVEWRALSGSMAYLWSAVKGCQETGYEGDCGRLTS